MVRYRRHRIVGGTYFFTVTLRDRRSTLLVERIDCLREAFRHVRRHRPFVVDAVVVLPDHLHVIWTLPPGDADYAGRWRALKGRFSRQLARQGIDLGKDGRGEYVLWQRRYWEHTIRNAADLARHMDYIHYNPVKHGHVTKVMDWPYSSFHRFVKAGVYPADWGMFGVELEGIGNE